MPYLTKRKKLKLQLSPGLVTSYDIQPGNRVCLFWDTTHTPDPHGGATAWNMTKKEIGLCLLTNCNQLQAGIRMKSWTTGLLSFIFSRSSCPNFSAVMRKPGKSHVTLSGSLRRITATSMFLLPDCTTSSSAFNASLMVPRSVATCSSV